MADPTPRSAPANTSSDVPPQARRAKYLHPAEARLKAAIEQNERMREEAIQELETRLADARRKLADWEAKGPAAAPTDPVESQNLRFELSQAINNFVARGDQLNREMESRRRDLESSLRLDRMSATRTKEQAATGRVGVRVSDSDLRIEEVGPALQASLDEEKRKVETFFQPGGAWQQGTEEYRKIQARILDIVSGRATAEMKRADAEQAALAAKQFPWESPQEAAAYAYVGNELWNLDMLTRHRSPIYPRGGFAHLIQGRSAHITWLPDLNGKAFCDDCPELTDAGADKPETYSIYAIRSTPGLPNMDQFRLSPADWRRFIFMAEGDLWRATIDWRTMQAEGVTRVTRTSQLSQARILHWHGRNVWLWTNLSQDKPVARIDLITGEIAETPSWNVFSGKEGETFISPSGKLLVRATPDSVAALNLESQSVTVIENSIHNSAFGYSNELKGHHRMSRENRAFTIGGLLMDGLKHAAWLPDERLLVRGHFDLAKGKSRDMRFVVDLRGGTVTAIPRSPNEASDCNIGYHFEQQLPDKVHFVVRRSMAEHRDADSRESRFLFNALTGQWLPLPEGAGYLEPVNDHLVLWKRADGGLSGSGTWMWDIASGETSRLTPLFISGSHGHMVYLPERNRLLAHAAAGAGGQSVKKLLVVDFKTGGQPEVRELPVDFASATFGDGRLAGIATEEFDLGFGADRPDPWAATAAIPIAGGLSVQRGATGR